MRHVGVFLFAKHRERKSNLNRTMPFPFLRDSPFCHLTVSIFVRSFDAGLTDAGYNSWTLSKNGGDFTSIVTSLCGELVEREREFIHFRSPFVSQVVPSNF